MILNQIKKYKVYFGLALALAVIAGACWLTWTVTDSRWQSKYDNQQTVYADASAKAEQAAREKEKEYASNLAKVNAAGEARVAESAIAAANANASVERLLRRINTLLADTRTSYSGTGQQGKSASEALDLLTDVLGKSIERNRQLASFADNSWDAAKQCEESYNAILH
jgi:hypothetical protein